MAMPSFKNSQIKMKTGNVTLTHLEKCCAEKGTFLLRWVLSPGSVSFFTENFSNLY